MFKKRKTPPIKYKSINWLCVVPVKEYGKPKTPCPPIKPKPKNNFIMLKSDK